MILVLSLVLFVSVFSKVLAAWLADSLWWAFYAVSVTVMVSLSERTGVCVRLVYCSCDRHRGKHEDPCHGDGLESYLLISLFVLG